MDERDGFLRAIREEPDDDVHRLVFADWLEDHDEPGWAALIRHQCGLARLLKQSADPFVDEGALDLTMLHPDVRKSLFDSLAPFLDLLLIDSGWQVTYSLWPHCSFYAQRGLLEHMRIIGNEALDAILEALHRKRGQWARSLRILSFGSTLHRHPRNSPFRFFHVSHERIGRFLRSRHFSNFSHIDLRGCSFDTRHPIPLPQRWHSDTRLWVHGHQIGLEADLERVRKRLGSCLVVDPPHPGDRALDDDIPF